MKEEIIMVNFLKKAMDWVLEKERDAANNCKVDIEDVEKQIKYVEEKRDKLKQECEENLSEFEHVLNRLHGIKASASKCETQKKD
jgi:septal ring factor EnvC (AmiA/AmiB activator)